MAARLYLIHGSHPCECARKALDLKGIEYKAVEVPPVLSRKLVPLRFEGDRVPALRLDGGERVQGTDTIMQRLDELVPEPPLYPADPDARARVVEAERFGDDFFQAPARRILVWLLARNRDALLGYIAGSKLPLPGPVAGIVAPRLLKRSVKINAAVDDAVREDLAALPASLERVDAWIEEGLLGGAQPNAADLQIGSSLALLRTVGDVRPLVDAHPAAALATRHFANSYAASATVPAGRLPAEWVPAAATPA